MRVLIAAAAIAVVGFAGSAQAVPFATSAVTQDVTSFGSGVLTGAPDGGGAFLSNTSDPPTLAGSIVFGFDVDMFDGAGADFRLIDVTQDVTELYDVAISGDGISFTSLGVFDTTVGDIDVNGLFAGLFSFIRVTNAGQVNSPDLDAAEALNVSAAVPVPAALPLMAAVVGVFGLTARRRRKGA